MERELAIDHFAIVRDTPGGFEALAPDLKRGVEGALFREFPNIPEVDRFRLARLATVEEMVQLNEALGREHLYADRCVILKNTYASLAISYKFAADTVTDLGIRMVKNVIKPAEKREPQGW